MDEDLPPLEPIPYEEPKREIKTYIILGIITIVLLAALFIFWPSKVEETTSETPTTLSTVFPITTKQTTSITPSGTVCGDGKCDPGENCYDCPKDCKCGEGEYCSKEQMKCIKPICGNGVCEPFESYESCCDDCMCPLDVQFCNETTHKCETPDIGLSESEIIQIVENYYKEEGKEIDSIKVQDVILWEGKVGRQVEIKVKGQEKLDFIMVTSNKEVIELPFF